MKEIKIGSSSEIKKTVGEDMLAKTVGSGSLAVLATPVMIAMMEEAACGALNEYLEGDDTTVGTFMSVTHDAATPLGMEVTAKAAVTAVNGREISFEVEAFDAKGRIGGGSHKRFLVGAERFMQKTNAKLS